MKKSTSAGGVVINQEGQILVVDQKGTSWSLPKGHTEPDESLLETATREIYEESGVHDLTFVRKLGVYERFRISDSGRDEDKRELKTIHIFLFTTNQTELNPQDAENPQAVWLDREDVEARLTHERDKAFFRSIINALEEI